MPRKSEASDEKERGSSSTLEAVKVFLQNDTIPESYSKNNKRALRRRAKQFVLIKDELYFTGGRSRHNRSLLEGVKEEAENPENEPDHTQVLRKVLFSEEEQQQAVDEAHVGEDGHYGMEKTTERVSNLYYWMGITFTVRNTIHSCLNCSSRSKISTLTNYKNNTAFPSSLAPLPPVPANASTAGSASANSAAIVSDVASAHDMTGKAGSESVDDDGDLVGLGDLNEDLGEADEVMNGVQTASSSVIKKQLEKQASDVYYVPKEVCSYFWQKVEIQAFGPYEAGKKLMYVVVALDSYSQFPEATLLEVLTAATLSHFILSLFCRYGVMEKLLLLQNQVTKNKEYYLNKTVLDAGISPALLFPQASLLDKRWRRIENSLHHFVKGYPEFWFHCLEAFMVPLRITVPPEADYSPHYLAHGREPVIPDALSKVCGINMEWREIQLTEDQERQAVEVVTEAYGIHSDNPCILPIVTTETQPQLQRAKPTESPAAVAHGTSDRMSLDRRKQSKTSMRRGAEKRPFGSSGGVGGNKTTGMKTENGGDGHGSGMDVDEFSGEQFDHDSDIQDDSDADVTYEPEIRSLAKKSRSDRLSKRDNHEQPATRTSTRERKITLKAKEADIFQKKERVPPAQPSKVFPDMQTSKESGITRPKARMKLFSLSKHLDTASKAVSAGETRKPAGVKAGRGRPHKNAASMDHGAKAFTMVKRKRVSADLGQRPTEIISNLEKLPLDTFYFVLKQYKVHGVFPPGMSDDSRQFLHVCEVMQAKDGKLYSNVGKSAGRLIITSEKARVGVLRKAHARGEEHYGRTQALKHLSDMNVFWKGMSLDLDAFIHACPECFVNNPLRNRSVVKIPSKASSFTAEERRLAAEDHLSEDEDEECGYDNIVQYLTDGTFPSSATLLQRLAISQRSASFRFVKGTLYYLSSSAQRPDADPFVSMPELRQVLMTEASRFKAVCAAHVEDGSHLSPQDTQARLRHEYFWSGMTFDIMAHVMGCCMAEALASGAAVPHRNPVIQTRVTKLLKYYSDMEIPKLDTSLLTAQENGRMVVEDNQVETAGQTDVQETSLNGEEGLGPTRSAQSQAGRETQVDAEVAKAVDAIIAETGKLVIGDDKATDYGWNNEGKVDVVGQAAVSNMRKDAHKCQYCGKFISGNVAFRVHLYKHTGVKPYSCETCGKSFTTSKSLQVHTRKHTGVKPYLCNRCGREFFRSTSFKYHLKTHNRIKGKPLPCDQCNREFLTQNRLDKHKEFKHPAEPKIYVCKHCGKVFTTARSLKWHEQSHTNPRKHQCPVCLKDFARKDYAEAHMRAAHTAEELEACGYSQGLTHNVVVSVAGDDDKQQEGLSVTQQLQPQVQEEQHGETTVELQEHQIQQLLPHFLHHAVVASETHHDHHQQQQQQQQQHIQLLHDVNIPTTSNISVIQWTQDEDEHHNQAPPSIIIDDHHLHQLQQQHHTHHHHHHHQQAPTTTHITLTSDDVVVDDPTAVITEHQMVVTSDLDAAFQAQHAHHDPHHHHQQQQHHHHPLPQPTTTTVHILAPAHLPSLHPPDASTLTTHPHHLTIPHLPASSSSLSSSSSSIPSSTATPAAAAAVTSSQLQQQLHSLQQQQQAQPTVVLATSGGGVLLKQEAVPVQYEVECMSTGGDTTVATTAGLTAADLHAVELLAHASLGGQNILH